MNALGEDRLGIVSDMTNLVNNAGGSVGESQATKLGSHFSLTMLVSVPSDNADNLKASLKTVEGMNTNSFETSDPKAAVFRAPAIGYSGQFVLSGVDDPGLVHKVTSLLAKHGLSIDTMNTAEEIAPHGGTTLFIIDGIATKHKPLPKNFDPDVIRDELEKLGDKLNCDITLTDNVGRKKIRPDDIWENVA